MLVFACQILEYEHSAGLFGKPEMPGLFSHTHTHALGFWLEVWPEKQFILFFVVDFARIERHKTI